MNDPVNIYIIGAQSTGKTTLVKALNEAFAGDESVKLSGRAISTPRVIEEVARSVMRSNNFETIDTFTSPEKVSKLQELILKAHWEEEKRATAYSWFISDRSGIDPIVYASLHGEAASDEILQETIIWKQLALAMQASLVVLCEPNSDWLTDDGFRYMPKDAAAWKTTHEKYCGKLTSSKIDYQIVPATMTSLDDRVAFVIGKWRERCRYTTST